MKKVWKLEAIITDRYDSGDKPWSKKGLEAVISNDLPAGVTVTKIKIVEVPPLAEKSRYTDCGRPVGSPYEGQD